MTRQTESVYRTQITGGRRGHWPDSGKMYFVKDMRTRALRKSTPSFKFLYKLVSVQSHQKLEMRSILQPSKLINRPPDISKVQNVVKWPVRRAEVEIRQVCCWDRCGNTARCGSWRFFMRHFVFEFYVSARRPYWKESEWLAVGSPELTRTRFKRVKVVRVVVKVQFSRFMFNVMPHLY